MARRELTPGEMGPVTYRGKHPETGKWVAESRLRQDKMKPTMWRATCRYRMLVTRERREVTAQDTAKARAETKLRASVEELRASESLDPTRAKENVREAIEDFLERLEAGAFEYSPGTVRTYRGAIRKHLLADDSHIAAMRLRDVTTRAARKELERILHAAGEATIRHCRAVLNRIFDDAVEAKAIDENPVASIRKLPKLRRQPKVYANGSARTKNRALSDAEVQRLTRVLEDGPAHVRDLLMLCLDEGLRISEAVSLRWQDVDVEKKVLHVRGKLVRVPEEGLKWDPFTKDLRYRTLPLRARALKALESRSSARRIGDWDAYVFQTPRGGAPDVDNYNDWVRVALDKAGLLDATVHTLRRTVERDLERAGATVAEREQFMGHTEQVARKHYADYSQAPLRVAELLD